MKTKFKKDLTSYNLIPLSREESFIINGGNAGDAAELIGRSYVWTIANMVTFGASSLYLLAKKLM